MASASVQKKGNRYWVVVSRPGNKREWIASYATSQEATRHRNEILGAIASDAYAPIRRITFAAMVDVWLEQYPVLRGMKPSTLRDYRSAFRAHWTPALGDRDLASITLEDLQRVVVTKLGQGVSARRMADIIIPLKTMFKWAVRWNYLRTNPAADLQRPKFHTPEADFLTPEEARRLIDAVDPYYRPLFLFMFMTGVRPGEGIAIRWQDVDLDAAVVNVRHTLDRGKLLSPKTENAKRRIPMPPGLVSELRGYREGWIPNPDGLVFVQPATGAPIDLSNLRNRVFHPALQKAGLRRIRLYDIRHSYAAWAISLNTEPLQLSRNMGHYDVGFTYRTYGHLLPASGHDEAARLGELLSSRAEDVDVSREGGGAGAAVYVLYPLATPAVV